MEDSQNASAVTTRSVGIRYGLMMAAVGTTFFCVLAISGVDIQGPARWVNVVFSIILIFLAHKYYKENGDGFMTIGQGTGIGFWMSLVSSILSSIFTYAYVKFIDTGFIQQMLDRQREAMEEKGTLTDDQIDQAMNMTAKFMTPEMMLIFGLVFGIIFGIIIALIVSLFTQKKNPEAFV